MSEPVYLRDQHRKTVKNRSNTPPSPLIVLPIMVYWILGLLIAYMNLGETSWGTGLANLGWNVNPSIPDTAAITTKPQSAALVLMLAWMFIPIMYVLVMAKFRLLVRSFKGLRPSMLINISSWAAALTFVGGALFIPDIFVPSDTGLKGSRISALLASSEFFVVFWGFVILISGWMVMLFMTLSSISLFQSLIYPNRGNDHE